MTTHAASARDAGFALISRINRWLIAAAVAVTGFLSLVAAHAFHGHTSASSPSGITQSAAPAPASPAPGPVVSGGS
jgi:hypothetical protein